MSQKSQGHHAPSRGVCGACVLIRGFDPDGDFGDEVCVLDSRMLHRDGAQQTDVGWMESTSCILTVIHRHQTQNPPSWAPR